jgi:hypothetical protein
MDEKEIKLTENAITDCQNFTWRSYNSKSY